MWTWGRRWTRALGSRGLTATTLTWPSSTTTWTRPSRRYVPTWTRCAANPSGSRWTGFTEDQLHWPLRAGRTVPPACLWPQRPKKRRLRQLFLQNNINSKKKKWYCSSSSWARTPCNGFSTQNSKGKSAYLFYNFVWEIFLFNVEFHWEWDNEIWSRTRGHIFALIYCCSPTSYFVVISDGFNLSVQDSCSPSELQ